MHRSGTSAMTRTLSLLGAALPKRLMPAAGTNERGFWEPQSVANLNDEILQALDSEWDDVFAFRPRHYLSNFDHFYLGRAVELLDQEFNGSEVIVLKDPRISVLATFWDRALSHAGYKIHHVVMVRNPLEVAESLRARDGFPREKSLLLWASYMIAAERDTRERERIFVGYDQLMDDWRALRRRIEASACFPFPRDTAAAANEIDRYLDRGMRHHEAVAQDLLCRSDVPDEVKVLYRIFSDACDGIDIDRPAVEAIGAELAKMDLMVGPLLADLRGRVRSLTRDVVELNDAQASASGRADSLALELETARARRLEEDAAAARAAADREREVAELAGRAAASEAERDRVTVELDGKRQEAAELADRVVAFEAERDRLTSELADKRKKAAELAQRIVTVETERDSVAANAEERSRRQSGELKSLQRLLERVEEDQRATEIALKEEQMAVETAREALARVEARLNDRFREVATLSNMLSDEEAREREARERADWLRQASAALVVRSNSWRGWLRGLLPAVYHYRRQQKLLQKRGLFDGAAYLAAHPDVAADGSDALLHYLTHGMQENRRRF
jgi:hypothetical protein